MKPLVIELYCGTFGWSHGWLARGGRAIGFDLEHLPHHGAIPDGASLVLQDVRTLVGSQFKDAALILASPPCQEFSYRAMPWTRARSLGPPELGMELFAACFRIQREASEAAGRHIPMVVENVRGAQKWVGRAPAHFGSYYLWGDVPVLMPKPQGKEHVKVGGIDWSKGDSFNGTSEKRVRDARHISAACLAKSHGTRAAVEGMKQPGISGVRANGKGDAWFQDGAASHGSKSSARKAASALIARIPERLSDWIAEVYFP